MKRKIIILTVTMLFLSCQSKGELERTLSIQPQNKHEAHIIVQDFFKRHNLKRAFTVKEFSKMEETIGYGDKPWILYEVFWEDTEKYTNHKIYLIEHEWNFLVENPGNIDRIIVEIIGHPKN